MMLALLLIPAVALYSELHKRSDIWWTPRTMLVPLSQSTDRVEVYVRGQPLSSRLEAGQLRIAGDTSAGVLSPGDVGFRFNNWDRIRAQRLPLVLVYAAVIGVVAVVFLLLVTDRLAHRSTE
jgi:hypothetical protein